MKHSELVLFGGLVAWALGGCAANPVATTPIEATDRGIVPTVRISANLSPRGGTEGAPSEPQSGHAVEFSAATARGSDSQTLGAGQPPIIFGGLNTAFNAPQNLKHEFDFAYYDISWRGRAFFDPNPIGLEVLLGLGYVTLDLAVSSPTQRAAETLNSAGFSAGIGVIWRIRPATSLQARVTAIALISDFDELARLEVFVVQALGRNAAVRAGFSAWRLKADHDSRSDIKVDFFGPSIGLDVNF